MEEKDPSSLPDGLLLPFVKRFPRLDVWSSLGRALPAKPSYMVKEDVLQKHVDLLGEPFQPCSDVPEKAAIRLRGFCEAGRPYNQIPFSESAAISLPRGTGGQANFLRESIALYRKMDGLCPWGDPPSADDIEGVRKWYERMFSFLDQPFLDHLDQCQGSTCKQVHLHFPAQLSGIPEGGWRTRIPTIPWISLVFMTKPVQAQLTDGMFKDPAFCACDPVKWKKIASRVQPREDELIISSDWKTGTDALSVEASKRTCEGYKDLFPFLERHIRASFSNLRMIEPGNSPPVWPGMLALVRDLRVRRERYQSNIHWIRELSNRYTRRVGGDFSFVLEEPSNPFNAVSGSSASSRAYRTFVRPATGRVPGERVPSMPVLRRVTTEFVPGVDSLSEDSLRMLSDRFILWYRTAFMCMPGELHTRGQHMSLPLSWVTMSALHQEMAQSLRIWFGWGDDALAVGTKDEIDAYKSRGRTIGVIFHETTKSYEVKHRGVFLEDLVDHGEWHHVPKARHSCRPGGETEEEGGWMSMYIDPPKVLSCVDRDILKSSREAFFWNSLQTAIKYGYDPTIPRFLGGMGQPGVGRTGRLNIVDAQEYDRLCGLIRGCLNVSSFDETRAPSPISTLGLQYLEKSRPEGDDEMYLKYFKVAYTMKLTHQYRLVRPPKCRTALLSPEHVASRLDSLLRTIESEGVARERSIIVKGSAVRVLKPEARFWLRQ